jgi:acyl-CoA reductase-like NAD-dependent aldehyde dehydrogenase
MPCAPNSRLKRVVVELGGKSAKIICADADLDKVIGDVGTRR